MRKMAVMAVGVIALGNAAAEDLGILATFGVANNYIWRGETRTDDRVAVYGTLDYRHESGLYAGAHTFNIDEDDDTGYQVDVYGGYVLNLGDWGVDLGLTHHEMPDGREIDPATGLEIPGTQDERDFTEYSLGVTRGGLGLRTWWTGDYFGSGEDGIYAELNYQREIVAEMTLWLHYGKKWSDHIDDHAGMVQDFGIGASKGPFKLMLTNLDDNEDGGQSDNGRITVSWEHQIML